MISLDLYFAFSTTIIISYQTSYKHKGIVRTFSILYTTAIRFPVYMHFNIHLLYTAEVVSCSRKLALLYLYVYTFYPGVNPNRCVVIFFKSPIIKLLIHLLCTHYCYTGFFFFIYILPILLNILFYSFESFSPRYIVPKKHHFLITRSFYWSYNFIPA